MLRIITCNTKYKDGETVGGYHEIHEVKYIDSARHIIATIESVIANNLLYKNDLTVLEAVNIECTEMLVQPLTEYYANYSPAGVKIYVSVLPEEMRGEKICG